MRASTVSDGGPPPLRPFGLVLHHDGSWTHEGVPIRNARLRAAFDRSVRFLPAPSVPREQARGKRSAQRAAGERSAGLPAPRRQSARKGRGAQRGEAERSSLEPGRYVVQLGRFRGQIEVEEAAFFVRDFDPATGAIRLSDGTSEPLDPETLRVSAHDGAGLCAIKRSLAPAGLLARFTHAAWAELAAALEGPEDAPRLRLAGRSVALPASLVASLDFGA